VLHSRQTTTKKKNSSSFPTLRVSPPPPSLSPPAMLRPKTPAPPPSTRGSLPSSSRSSSSDPCCVPSTSSNPQSGQRRVVSASVRFFSIERMVFLRSSPPSFPSLSLCFELSDRASRLLIAASASGGRKKEKREGEKERKNRKPNFRRQCFFFFSFFVRPPATPTHNAHLLLSPQQQQLATGPALRHRPGRHHGRRRARHGGCSGLGRRARGLPRRLLALPGNRRLLLLRLLGQRQPELDFGQQLAPSDDGRGRRGEGGERDRQQREAPAARLLWEGAEAGRSPGGGLAVPRLWRHGPGAVLPVQGQRVHEDVN